MSRLGRWFAFVIVSAALGAGISLLALAPSTVSGGLDRSIVHQSGHPHAAPGLCSTSVRCTPVGPVKTPPPAKAGVVLGFIGLIGGIRLVTRRSRTRAYKPTGTGAVPTIFHPPITGQLSFAA